VYSSCRNGVVKLRNGSYYAVPNIDLL